MRLVTQLSGFIFAPWSHDVLCIAKYGHLSDAINNSNQKEAQNHEMSNFIMKTVKLLFPFLLISQIATASSRYDLEGAFRQLDQAMEKRNVYIQIKESQISKAKRELTMTEFGLDRYVHYKLLYTLYKKYDGDSALNYAQRCYEIGITCHREDWKKEATLNAARIMISRGVIFMSRDMLNKCGPIDQFPKDIQDKLAIAQLNYNWRVSARPTDNSTFWGLNNSPFPANWQFYKPYIKPNSIIYFNAMSALGIYRKNFKTSVKRLIVQCKPNDYDRLGKLYFLMALYMKTEHDTNGHLFYLIQSAICDIKQVNRASSSMLQLIESPLIQQDINRAYHLSIICEEDAKAFKDYNRSVSIITAQDAIIKQYQRLRNTQRMWLLAAIFFVLLLCVVVTTMFIMLRTKARRQKITNKKLKLLYEAQKQHALQIESMSKELMETNAKLVEEMKLRDTNFMDTYYLCTNYIKMYGNLKKSILALLKTHSYKDAISKVSSTGFEDAELREFYKKFDQAFLSTHTDFVERLNRLLKPEEQYHLESDESLPSELRIYALISLGITNSVNIADFLHYSPQTVYNYRLKVRHKACINEKNFDQVVEDLYDDTKLDGCFHP